MEELLTIKQVAKLLSVNAGTLRRWDKEGKLKAAFRIGTRKGVGDRRYKIIDVENYLNRK